MAGPSKHELFAWRNKGYDDGVAGRPISPTARRAPAAARRVYLEGRRVGRDAKAAASSR